MAQSVFKILQVNPILIVDDDQPTQQLLQALMRRNGYSCRLAANGAEALRVLNEEPVSLVILDLMMPQVDGQAVIDFLTSAKSAIPVVVCTAAGARRTDGIRNDVVKAIIRKPFDIDQLTQVVSALLSGHNPGAAGMTT